MVVVPLATPVTIPEVLIVATAGVEEVHVPPVMLAVKVDVPPMTAVVVPVMVGNAFMVEVGSVMVCVVAPVEVSEMDPL